jgi:hypothetical protein
MLLYNLMKTVRNSYLPRVRTDDVIRVDGGAEGDRDLPADGDEEERIHCEADKRQTAEDLLSKRRKSGGRRQKDGKDSFYSFYTEYRGVGVGGSWVHAPLYKLSLH